LNFSIHKDTNMKKNIFNILTACLLIGSIASCELDETVYSIIPTQNFYKTAGDAEAALTAAYDPLADMYNSAVHEVADFSADQIYPRPVVARDAFALFTYDPTYSAQVSFNRYFESPIQVWESCYDGIEKANWVIARVPDIVMNEARKNEIIGEAYFLRAFYHWMATKNFGDVVIKTVPSITQNEAYAGVSSRAQVYTQIYADLTSAIENLPSYNAASTVKGRPSKEAAMALFAKAALYNEDWATALQMAQNVINSGKYSLMPNVLDVYNVAREDVARQENIFAFESESATPGRISQIPSLYGPPNSQGPAYGKTSFGSAFAYQSFFDSFNPADKRRQLLDTNYVNGQGQVIPQRSITPVTTRGVLVKKYQDPNSNGGAYAINLPILRLADVYLLAAEAEARLNGASGLAYNYINVVRKRAGLEDLTTGLSQAAFIDAVLQERSWELFAEADRWYDLTRTGKFLTVVPTAVNNVFPTRTPQPRHKYFPIPQDEVNANPLLEQNPDWR
jgi:hypothetical protein